jgi:hypothetical protein
LQNVCYTPSNGSVSNAIPGVFFYFTSITAPAANFTLFVEQTKSCNGFNLFRVQQGKDIKLFDEGCNKLMTVTPSEAPAGRAKLIVKGAIPGAKYVLSVKYNVKSLIGSTYTGPAPECVYSFVTIVDGVIVPHSDDSIIAAPGCSDNTPVPLDCSLLKKAVRLETDSNSDLLKIYPNPFSEKVTFEFVSQKNAHAVLDIQNIVGQRVKTVMDEQVKEGILNRVEYQPNDQASGIFIYRLMLDDEVVTGKIVYNKNN